MPVVTTMVGEVDVGDLDYGDEEAQIAQVTSPPKDGGSDNIRVAVRVRPPNKREQSGSGGGVCVKVDKGVVRVEKTPFAFDVAFPMECTQLDVFEAIGIDICQCCFNGYNAALFAYGQTSSGKSFSMMGVRGTALVGIIPRIARLLFLAIKSDSTKEVLVETSYMEIYNEKLRDLLSDSDSTKELKVRENKQLGVHVAGLTKESVTSEEDTLSTIDHGTKHRTTAATLYNSESSRSHAVFEITMQSKFFVSGTEMRATSRVALIDLAGSERSDKLGSKGAALKEGNNINKSLTVLGRCIRALVEVAKGKKTSVPFRESVLTWYLRDSLSGNARTTMLAACSPVASNIEETLSTLRYADSAKSIKTAAVKNEDPAQAKIRELNSELEELKRRLEEAEQGGGGGGGGGRSSVTDAQKMSNDEKESLMEELARQMEMLGEGGFTSSKLNASKSRRTSVVFNGTGVDTDQFPMLTCLSKDTMLNHAMAIPIIGNNFKIGRSGVSGEKNGFELDGMGIQARHCSFHSSNGGAAAATGDKKNNSKKPTMKVSLCSANAAVYVNGVAMHEMDSDDDTPSLTLQHLDRVVLGPCRLVCIYLTQPMTQEDKDFWNYDACFTELSMRGKSSALSLLTPIRRDFVNHIAEIETGPILQANTIAQEMACNIRFCCQGIIQGQEGLDQIDITLDEYIDMNHQKLQIKCLVDASLPQIKTARDMHRSTSFSSAKLSRQKSIKFNEEVNDKKNSNKTSLVTLWSINVDEFQDVLVDLKAAHSSFMKLAGGLNDETQESSSVFKAVFDSVDTDNSGNIDKDELETAIISFNHTGDPDFLNLVRNEQKLSDDLLLDYNGFESFLIHFLQRQFYHCIEHYVTNRNKFIEIGGRDIHGLAAEADRDRNYVKELSSIIINREAHLEEKNGEEAVNQFLKDAGLAKHFHQLLHMGVDNMIDLLDESLLSNSELKEAGLNADEITTFRKHAHIHQEKTKPSLESLLNDYGLSTEFNKLKEMGIATYSGNDNKLSKHTPQGGISDELLSKSMAQEAMLIHMLSIIKDKITIHAKKTASTELKAKIQKRRASLVTTSP